MKNTLSSLFCLVVFYSISHAQRRIEVTLESQQPPALVASAGNDLTAPSGSILLGGSPAALGGTEPYSYQWQPSVGLSDATLANPAYLVNQTQTYTLLITDQRGCTALDTITITLLGTPSATGDESGIVLFPNPGSGMIRLACRQQTFHPTASVKIFDAGGRLLKSSSWSSLGADAQLDLSLFSAGTYTISIVDGEKHFSNSFIINR
jgi:hypothetical protein